MKKYITILLFVFMASLRAQPQDHFVGNWTADGRSQPIEIYVRDSAYYAKIRTRSNSETDNSLLLIQMIKKSDNQLYGGTYYDDTLKSEYEAKLKLIDDNTIRLKIIIGLFNKTIYWHRVDLDWEEKPKAVTVLQH